MIQYNFDEAKATEVAAEFLQRTPDGALDDVILMKLMYFADRKSLELYDRPIIGDKLYCMENGPVLSGVLQLLNATHGKFYKPFSVGNSIFIQHIKRWLGTVSLKAVPQVARLTRAEKRIINEVFEQYGRMNRDEIVEVAHGLGEYVETPAGKRNPLQYEDILKSLGRSAEEIDLASRKASSAYIFQSQANQARTVAAFEQPQLRSKLTS